MIIYTKAQSILLQKLFKFEYNDREQEFELYYNSYLPNLLSGKGKISEGESNMKFIPLRYAPDLIKSKLTKAICDRIYQQLQLNKYEMHVQTITFEAYFLARLKDLFKTSDYKEDYRSYQSIYASYDYLSTEKVAELAMLHAMIILIQRFLNDPIKISFIYEHLCENNYGVDIPLTSLESFKKYIKRKKDNLPKSIIHGLYQKNSNNKSLTELMEHVIIWLAVMVPTRRAVYSIKEDLDYIIETMPNAKNHGIYSISESKIDKFLKEPKARNLISYAKDNNIDFKRKVLGVMRFARASGTLVRIYIDGYVFQVEHKNGKKVDRLTGIFISDDFSDYIISHGIGNSENFNLLMQVLEEYFRVTKNGLPHEIVMDKYTYKIMKKNRTLMKVLKRYGLEKGRGLTISSNPNRKSRLERFFNTFQQKFMPSIIHYIGPGIKSRLSNSHPFKEFLITLRRDLPEEFDIILVLNRLIKIHYNKEYISPSQQWLLSPQQRFMEEEKKPLSILDEKVIPTLFYELHKVTCRGGAIMIKRKNEFYIFYKREFEFLNKFNGKKVDAYFNLNSDEKSILLYEVDTTILIAEINLFKIIPAALFDRTEEHKKVLNNFSKDTKDLLLQFSKEFEKIEETIHTSLNGRDIREFTKLTKMKKEKSIEQDLAEQMNLKNPHIEPKLYHANLGSRRTKDKNAIENLGMTIIDTI